MAGGGHIFVSPVIAGEKIENMSKAEVAEEPEKSHATLLLMCSDDNRYRDLAASLNSGTLRGRDEYPETLAAMYQLTKKHSSSLQDIHGQLNNRRRQAISLVQANEDECQQELVPGTDGRTHDVTFFNCNHRGHYAVNCPEPDRRIGLSNLQCGNVLAHIPNDAGFIPPDWFLLDTCSTDNVVRNKNLFSGIRPCSDEESLEIFTNGGSLMVSEIGNLKNFPMDGFYNPNSIANVLLFKLVADLKGHYVKMNTKDRPEIYVVRNGREL